MLLRGTSDLCWSSSSITYLSPLEGHCFSRSSAYQCTNCAPLLADLFLYSYESEFLQKLVKDKKIHEARAFNFTYRYIDDVLSINNSRFAEFLPLIYPPELELKRQNLQS